MDEPVARGPEDSYGLLETGRALQRVLLPYQFGVDELLTKVSILREEFVHLHDYNPIEHIAHRIKSPESIVAKMARKICH